MRKTVHFFIALFAVFLIAQSFKFKTIDKTSDFITENINFAARQYGLQTEIIEKSGEVLNPKSIIDGKMKYIRPQEWTSGFFPGSMWYLYELTGDEKWKNLGTKYTEAIEEVKNLTSHHDVGFMIGCSFGNALRLTGNERYKDVIVQAAKSLSTRFRPVAGIIQSWNITGGWQAERGWECPVIIDNMMNLELLFDATKYSGDSTFYQIAITHADKTIEHHFRDDYTTWHVIDYSLEDGSVRNKHTAQGFAPHSTWARGQSWGIYGYVVCYRETGNPKYLEQAKKAFEVVAKHINMPEDKVPYWDYDAPNIPNALRDASSAAIMASALYELATYENREYYKGWADDILESLTSPAYRAEVGENGNFLLKHSVGSIPHGSEIDVPLNYADYYFLEALKRKRDLER